MTKASRSNKGSTGFGSHNNNPATALEEAKYRIKERLNALQSTTVMHTPKVVAHVGLSSLELCSRSTTPVRRSIPPLPDHLVMPDGEGGAQQTVQRKSKRRMIIEEHSDDEGNGEEGEIFNPENLLNQDLDDVDLSLPQPLPLVDILTPSIEQSSRNPLLNLPDRSTSVEDDTTVVTASERSTSLSQTLLGAYMAMSAESNKRRLASIDENMKLKQRVLDLSERRLAIEERKQDELSQVKAALADVVGQQQEVKKKLDTIYELLVSNLQRDK